MVLVACFILVHETLATREPNPELLATAMLLLGLPPVLRLDQKRRNGKEGEE